MEKFAGYGFNKSHSAAYAVLSYQTAWLKTHYPAAFMAAVLSSDMDKTDKVVTLIDECNRMGLKVEPPDVNASQYMFTVSGPKAIRYGLGAIKGVGQAAVENMLAERTARRALHRPARPLPSPRPEPRQPARARGAGARRRARLARREPRDADAPVARRDAGRGPELACEGGRPERPVRPGRAGALTPTEEAVELRETLPDWSEAVRLAGERETLGLYLTGHPITEYERELKPIISGRIADIGGARPVGQNEGGWRGPGRSVTVAGLVLEIRKRGGRTSFVLDDRSGRLEVTMFDDVYQQYRALVARDAILVVDGGLRWDDFIEDWRLSAKRILDVDQAREQYARRLVLRWPRDAKNGDARKLVTAIEQALRPSRGGRCSVAVRYSSDAAARSCSSATSGPCGPRGTWSSGSGRSSGATASRSCTRRASRVSGALQARRTRPAALLPLVAGVPATPGRRQSVPWRLRARHPCLARPGAQAPRREQRICPRPEPAASCAPCH